MQDYGGTITWVPYATSVFDIISIETTDSTDNSADTNSEIESDADNDNDDGNDDTTKSGCGSSLTAIPVMLATAAYCVCVKRKRNGRREK